jgi:Tfp pilus assembly protein PilN
MPVITAQRAVIAASFVFLALAAWSGTAYARDVLAGRTAGAAREAQKQALQTEVAHLRGNAAEIARLREALAHVAGRPPAAALLRKISATIPPEIACDALAVTTEGFTLNGHLAPTAPANAGEAWRARLTDPAWTLDLKPAPARDGAFTLAGVFPR